MKIAAASVSNENAPIELRERVYFNKEKTARMLKKIHGLPEVSGCIILSTCNRTEIYLSLNDGCGEVSAGELMLRYSGQNYGDFKAAVREYYGADAAVYAAEVACGLHSAILCDEQIAGQMNCAARLSRSEGCCDASLNTLFRLAVSAGKRALTEIRVSGAPLCAARGAVEMLERFYGSLKGKRGLVIGNGKMGILAAELLIGRGCDTCITLREYRHGENIVPKGCKTVGYSERIKTAETADFIISATKSPHYTVKAEDAAAMRRIPEYIFDLAVPRDIAPEIYKMTKCFNIDDIQTKEEIGDSLEAVKAIARRGAEEFAHWSDYRAALSEIEGIKNIAAKRLLKTDKMRAARENGDFSETAAAAAYLTADMLIGAMKEYINPETMRKCREKIEKGARL